MIEIFVTVFLIGFGLAATLALGLHWLAPDPRRRRANSPAFVESDDLEASSAIGPLSLVLSDETTALQATGRIDGS